MQVSYDLSEFSQLKSGATLKLLGKFNIPRFFTEYQFS